jgi:hypothetical protein
MIRHSSYRDLPPLAGICGFDDAMKSGLSVESCVARLKRYHYVLKRLREIFVSRLTSEPIYELKMAFSYHAHVCAEHVASLRKRVGEMRGPPLGLETVPHPALEILTDEVLCAPTTEELLTGIYEKIIPAIQSALERHLADTNSLVDHPSVRMCRFALLDLSDLQKFGAQAIGSLVSDEKHWRKVMVNFTWSLALNTQLKPIERHAVLYFIEQGLMPKNGKRFEWELARASGDPLAALFQDFDWADEVLHARIGRDWYLKEFSDPRTAVKYGDECWSKVLMDWGKYREEGLTEHRNWWPEIYNDACKSWGVKPDPEVLNYSTSYEKIRADLKQLVVSG